MLGINHTGAAESANKMIKSSPRSPHFLGVREAYSRTHEWKAAALHAKVVHQFRATHFLFEMHGPELSRPILKRIDLCSARSHAWAIQKSHDYPHAYCAWHKKKERCWELIYDGHNPPECGYNETSSIGLPCPHITAVCREWGTEGFFPFSRLYRAAASSHRKYRCHRFQRCAWRELIKSRLS
jgi:hypothetical protein